MKFRCRDHSVVVTLLVLSVLPILTVLSIPCLLAEKATALCSPQPSSPVSSPLVVATPSAVIASPSASASPAIASPSPLPTMDVREIPDIHAKISIPQNWTLIPGKLLEGDVLLATREKISNENDPWTTGISMSIDRNGAQDSKMKAGDYAMTIAKEAREKAGEEATPITESQHGDFREISFEFPVAADPPLQVTEVLRANDKTGTVAVILWQSLQSEAASIRGLRDALLSGIILDPSK